MKRVENWALIALFLPHAFDITFHHKEKCMIVSFSQLFNTCIMMDPVGQMTCSTWPPLFLSFSGRAQCWGWQRETPSTTTAGIPKWTLWTRIHACELQNSQFPKISALNRHLKFIFKVSLPGGEQWIHTKGITLFMEAGVSHWLVFLI